MLKAVKYSSVLMFLATLHSAAHAKTYNLTIQGGNTIPDGVSFSMEVHWFFGNTVYTTYTVMSNSNGGTAYLQINVPDSVAVGKYYITIKEGFVETTGYIDDELHDLVITWNERHLSYNARKTNPYAAIAFTVDDFGPVE